MLGLKRARVCRQRPIPTQGVGARAPARLVDEVDASGLPAASLKNTAIWAGNSILSC